MGIMDRVNELLPGRHERNREEIRQRDRDEDRVYRRDREDQDRYMRDRDDRERDDHRDREDLSRLARRDEERPTRAERARTLRDDFDRWLQRAFENPFGLGRMFDPRSGIDIRESDRELTARVETPGFGPSDVEVTVSPGRLSVRADKGNEERSEERGYRSERRTFTRSVSLPHGLDLNHVEAQMRNGLLTIRIPRTGIRQESRRVPIQD
jgi:HSP20 family protein